MDNIFREKARGLEDEFFAKRDREILTGMRRKAKQQAREKALQEVSGITDTGVLEVLVDLGITPETLAALSLVPLLEVAWADRRVDEKEREAILKAAHEIGITEGTESHQLLEGWLADDPHDSLMNAWTDYVSALKGALNDENIAKLRDQILGQAEQVARASGGFLGLGDKVSEPERKMLDRLAGAFD